MRIAGHAIFHSVARQFIVATNGDPHADKFFPWLNQPEQHELKHAFFGVGHWRSQDAEDMVKAFIEVLAVELDHWRDEQDDPLRP